MSPNNKEKCSHSRYVSREMFERRHRNLSSFDIDRMRVINCDDCQKNIWHLNLIKVPRPAQSTGLAESMIVQKGGGNEHSVEVRGNFDEPSGAKGGRVIRPGETEKDLSTLSTEATKYNDFRKIPDNEVEEPQGESVELTDSVTGEKTQALLISKNCECQFLLPYGFVPEDGCEEHDTKQFHAFIQSLLSQTKREAYEEGRKEQFTKVRREAEEEIKKRVEAGYYCGLVFGHDEERQRILKIVEGMSKESDGEYMDIIWNQDPRSEYYNRALSDLSSRLQEEPKHNEN